MESIAPLSGEPTWHQWEAVLLANGYRFALFDTLNRFYVAEERADLLARMPTERALGMPCCICMKLVVRAKM